MNYEIDEETQVIAVRVRAALELVPRILGPKEIWGPWMLNNLRAEIDKLLPSIRPSASSPHPRILGSLERMLFNHYTGGMGIDTLLFSDVRADDPMVTDPNYVDIPMDQLPDLDGSNFWWNELPPSVTLSVAEEPKPVGPTDLGTHLKRKRRISAPEPGPSEPPLQKKKRKSQEIMSQAVVSDQGEGKVGSQWKAKVPDVPVKVCDSCRSRGSSCKWPESAENSGSRTEKRACIPCASHKTRCTIAGNFSPPTAAASQRSTPEKVDDELVELAIKLSERIAGLEEIQTAHDETNIQFATRITWLERRSRRSKKATKAGNFSICSPEATASQRSTPEKVDDELVELSELSERIAGLEEIQDTHDEQNIQFETRITRLELQFMLPKKATKMEKAVHKLVGTVVALNERVARMQKVLASDEKERRQLVTRVERLELELARLNGTTKAAEPQRSTPKKVDDCELLFKLRERVVGLEKMYASDEEQKIGCAARIARLELQFMQLKKAAGP